MPSLAMFVLLVVGLGLAVSLILYTFGMLRLRGPRLVTCPEARETAAVELAAGRSAFKTPFGRPRLQLKDCTRWPLREECGRKCLAQIERAPIDCALANILKSWYRDKTCSMCGRAFGDIEAWDHKPGFLDSEGRSWEWSEFPPETIPTVLASHRPVCWDCHITEALYRQYPDRVVERPDGWQLMSSLYH